MGKGIYGWIGGRYGSPTEYGLPLDPSYLYEDEEEEDAEPSPCACQGQGWIGCECQGERLDPHLEIPGDDWTPVPMTIPESEVTPMERNDWQGRKFDEALDRLLAIDVAPLFRGIHRMNAILEEREIPSPMAQLDMFALGQLIGAVSAMQTFRAKSLHPAKS